MRTKLDALLTEKSIRIAAAGSNSDLFEYLRENHPDVQPMLRQTCAKLTIELCDEMDRVCDILEITKRQFIEAALVDAVRRAKEIMEQEGVMARLEADATLSAAVAGLAHQEG